MNRFWWYRAVAIASLSFIILWEAYGLLILHGRNNYTDVFREARFDKVAGPIFILVWTWLTFHFFFNPWWKGGAPGWRDLLLYIPIGILLVLVAASVGHGFRGYRQ